MLTGINIYETRDFVSKYDPDKDSPTIFKIGCLDSIIRAQLRDESTTYEIGSGDGSSPTKTTLNMSRTSIRTVKFGLKGIENFLDPQTEQPVKFETVSLSMNGKNYNVVSDRIIAMIPPEIIEELAQEILKVNTVNEDERKN